MNPKPYSWYAMQKMGIAHRWDSPARELGDARIDRLLQVSQMSFL